MQIIKIGENIVFTFGNDDNEQNMLCEKEVAKEIINDCRLKGISIEVDDNFDAMRKVLWNSMTYVVQVKYMKLCDDILRCIEYINGEEMRSDESV